MALNGLDSRVDYRGDGHGPVNLDNQRPTTLVIAWMLSRDARRPQSEHGRKSRTDTIWGNSIVADSYDQAEERTSEFWQLVSALIEEERIGYDELYHTLTRSGMSDAEFGP